MGPDFHDSRLHLLHPGTVTPGILPGMSRCAVGNRRHCLLVHMGAGTWERLVAGLDGGLIAIRFDGAGLRTQFECNVVC